MACGGNRYQPGGGPAVVQAIGRAGWANHVIAALNDRAGDVFDSVDVFDDLVIFAQESGIAKVVIFDFCKGQGVRRGHGAPVWRLFQCGKRAFPFRPGAGVADLDILIVGK